MLQAHLQKRLPHFLLEVKLQVANEILVMVGPSGAGKTTVLQCLAGLRCPEQGEIKIGATTVFSSTKQINLPPRSRRVGYVFQDYALFPHMTVLKNIIYGVPKGERQNDQLNIQELMKMLKIFHLKDNYPNNISGGEKQRVALARALMTSPELLLLDEPLSALDHDTRTTLQKELRELQKLWQIPFVLVTHDLTEANVLGDQIIRIDQGHIC